MPRVARQLRKKPLQLARGAPRARRLRRRVSVERLDKRPQKPACVGPAQERQQQPAPAKKRLRRLSQCKSKSRPHQSPRCRPHPKPASPSKLRQTSKASAHERRLFPFHRKQAASLHQSWAIDRTLDSGVRLPQRSLRHERRSPRRNRRQPRQATHKSSNTRSAYARTNSTRHAAGKTVTSWKTGSAPKRRSCRRRHALSPPDLRTPPSQKVRQAPDTLRGLFHAPENVTPSPCRAMQYQSPIRAGGVSDLAGSDVLPCMIRKRGNPNWGRPMRPAPVVATEFEMQVRQLHLTADQYVVSAGLRSWCEENRNQ